MRYFVARISVDGPGVPTHRTCSNPALPSQVRKSASRHTSPAGVFTSMFALNNLFPRGDRGPCAGSVNYRIRLPGPAGLGYTTANLPEQQHVVTAGKCADMLISRGRAAGLFTVAAVAGDRRLLPALSLASQGCERMGIGTRSARGVRVAPDAASDRRRPHIRGVSGCLRRDGRPMALAHRRPSARSMGRHRKRGLRPWHGHHRARPAELRTCSAESSRPEMFDQDLDPEPDEDEPSHNVEPLSEDHAEPTPREQTDRAQHCRGDSNRGDRQHKGGIERTKSPWITSRCMRSRSHDFAARRNRRHPALRWGRCGCSRKSSVARHSAATLRCEAARKGRPLPPVSAPAPAGFRASRRVPPRTAGSLSAAPRCRCRRASAACRRSR